jgi:hypothetical protein
MRVELGFGLMLVVVACGTGGAGTESPGAGGAGGAGGGASCPGQAPDDGCNTCVCSRGAWACTARACAPSDAGVDAQDCGGTRCTSTEVCVHPSCGGGTAICNALGDAAACPSGWTASQCFAGGGPVPGCQPPPCVPPAPYCFPLPAACTSGPTCTCLPNDVCSHADAGGVSGGQCMMASGRDVSCGSA